MGHYSNLYPFWRYVKMERNPHHVYTSIHLLLAWHISNPYTRHSIIRSFLLKYSIKEETFISSELKFQIVFFKSCQRFAMNVIVYLPGKMYIYIYIHVTLNEPENTFNFNIVSWLDMLYFCIYLYNKFLYLKWDSSSIKDKSQPCLIYTVLPFSKINKF